ncbi:DNA-directed RNA polymerase subunit K [Candidatus Pacearchaeota archaeon]|nr:DNA-directed RNA polymerase subunit K [Candidatus Pacearchaeota archaeon]
MLHIEEKKKEEIREKFTKYEIARILGARALQLSMNAPFLAKLDKKELEDINYDPFRIAEFEFYQGILPITVKRPMPKKGKDKVLEKTAEKKEEEKKVKEEKLEEKKEEQENYEARILKEVQDTEAMELAQPDDEAEVIETTAEEA